MRLPMLAAMQRRRRAAIGGAGFTPLTLSPYAFWTPTLGNVWTSDAGTGAAAVSDAIGRIDDRTGNGWHLPQATAGFRAILRNSGSSYWLEFDGSDDKYKVTWTSSLPTGFPMPYTRINVVRQTTWTLNDRLWDGGTGNEAAMRQAVASPNLSLENASGISLNDEVLGDWMVITERNLGAATASSVAVDNNAYTTQGAAWLAKNATGFTLGCFGDGTSAPANMDWAGGVIFDRALSDTEIAQCRTYFGALVGKVL